MTARRVLGAAALLVVTVALAGDSAPAVAAPPAAAAAPPAAQAPAAAQKDAVPPRADAKEAAAPRAEPRAASWAGPDRPKVTPGVLVRAARKAQQREAAACGPCTAPPTAQSVEIEWRAAPTTP